MDEEEHQIAVEHTIENSVEFVLSRLNSNDTKQIIDTIIQIKNLIIGNNKYKSFYLKENLIDCLIQIVNKHTKQQDSIESNDLINQILIIFASFSLGNLELIIRLIKWHQLHDLLYSLLKLNQNDCSNLSKVNLRIIESTLRCLANLYSSCQLVPSLIYLMDKHLYDLADGTRSTLELMLKYYPLTNMTKQSVITIVSISSTIISIALTSSNRYLINTTTQTTSTQSTINQTKKVKQSSRLLKLDDQLRRNRTILLKSDCITKFAHLLTSLLEPVQLQTLKFYSSICFENADAAQIILTTNYYDYSLVDLISAYLSRENSCELQLHAAKCLTNLCRSLLKLSTHKPSRQLAKPKPQITQMTTRSKVTTLRKLNKIKLEESSSLVNTADECEIEPNDTQIPRQDSCFYKLIDYSSQLIRLRTLPTLVRLCCTYSAQYRSSNSSSQQPSSVSNHYFDLVNFNNKNSKIQLNQQSYLNLLLLIQSVSTLTYLIELNSDLQTTAGCLEQIIPTLAFNIIDAYALFDLNKLKQTNQQKILKKTVSTQQQTTKLNEINIKKRRLFNSVERINSMNKKTIQHSNQKSSSSSSSASSSSTSTPSSTTNAYNPEQQPLIEYSSLFSLFYLNYNQFSAKGVQFKLNEHQYRQLTVLDFNPVDLDAKQNSESRVLTRINRYLSVLSQTVHKRLASVCFHALAALAANNEEARRQISENSGLISRLIDSVNLNQENAQDDSNKLKTTSLNDLNYLKLDDFLTDIKLGQESDDLNFDDENSDDDLDEGDLIDELEEDFDDLNQTDADLLRLSGLCLLHSLSRSVHQLRTKFLDKKIWLPILDLIKRGRQRRLEKMNLLRRKETLRQLDQDDQVKPSRIAKKRVSAEFLCSKDELDDDESAQDNQSTKETMNEDESEQLIGDDVEFQDSINDLQDELNCDGSLNEQNLISITTAILANLLLDFSPSKETMIENGIIKILVELLEHKNHSVRVNCMWSLMNLAFQADQKTKQLILSTITMEKLFQLLTEQDETLVLKTLGLIRNLISSRTHIDLIMSTCGTKIIQAIVMILESEYYNINIKEQALCILSNVADGQSSKEFIMNNEDLLRKINSFMTHNSVELQLAAVFCISNLVWSNDEGALERQSKLKEMGAQKILQKLLQSVDQILFEKVKLTLQQFTSNNLQSLSSSSSSSTSSLINSGSTTNLH